ncbi:hypothetical protein BV902_16210 [Sphingobacterium sp. B29]|nr:hypothetical protein BV902_16210 [Sphingobacterium sp. B29]
MYCVLKKTILRTKQINIPMRWKKWLSLSFILYNLVIQATCLFNTILQKFATGCNKIKKKP